ncbi:ferritin-like fold-containing protein [Aeromicrobium wangtongii]|uniref:Ferritin-like domain-containing protein n=1 Tax=Aeromicrobium wangtongii TaxID=2969247 RepID=A0ABY5M436_9ACTN|nr:ferritin-like fold-containing protein [Aeromicrobium wangtongii]MCD9199033.1 ferritin-like domain-containing protein [Aeromicrobium wangtongii]UUP12935.1 ferritin-like domain-containing protein [Aeromicrobium wangtongii]
MVLNDVPPPSTVDDPVYRTGVLELLGLLAYGEISACERLAEDAKMAPDLRLKVEIAAMASAEFGHFAKLRDHLVAIGEDPFEAMRPFAATFERYHQHTKPSDWLEGLVKAYVGDGLAADFYREIAAYLDAETRELVLETLSGTGHSEFVVEAIRAAIEQDPRLGGRLALWGRRLMGEALSQAQMVVAERDALSTVLVGGVDHPGMDLAAIGRMFTRLTEAHAARMEKLGLAA